MNIPDQFVIELIHEAQADEVGLWFIIGRIRDTFDLHDDELLMSATIECVDRMLASGTVVAGYYRPDGSGVEVWGSDKETILSRITRAWYELGREPDIGEVVVFVHNDRSGAA